MSLMMHRSSKPVPSHNFLVFIGVSPISFSKVSSIEVEIETEALAEGGMNGCVHSLSKPASSERKLIFERGVASGGLSNTAVLTSLRVGSFYKFIIVSVLNQNGLPKKTYMATDAVLKKRRLSDLDAMSGGMFVESLEFAYKNLTEVPGADFLAGLS